MAKKKTGGGGRMTKKEFYAVFKVMAEYYGAKPTDALMEIYWQTFQNWSLEDFKRACNLIMQTRVYPSLPKIPEITEMIQGRPEDRAALAYETLVKTMRQIGSWETVIFEDGAISRAVEAMGGWEQINEWSVDEWKFRKKDFEQLYLANLRSGRTEPITLCGAFDRINGATGQEGFNKPVLITREMKFLPGGELKQIEKNEAQVLSLVKKS
jgi:hypothetical protein